MSKFETIAINLQALSITRKEAMINFSGSCERCVRFGRNVSCDGCQVKQAHIEKLAVLDDIAYAENLRKQQKENYQRYIEQRIQAAQDMYNQGLIDDDELTKELDKISDSILIANGAKDLVEKKDQDECRSVFVVKTPQGCAVYHILSLDMLKKCREYEAAIEWAKEHEYSIVMTMDVRNSNEYTID